jgi:hypothetical protein
MTTIDTPAPDHAHHRPTFGFTKHGHPVHGKVIDHLPDNSAYARFNKRIALGLTKYVGTMTTFWLFCLLALCSLPSVLSGFHVFHGVFPAWMIKVSIIALVAWVAQTFIQLVLLPALMVGQNLQNVASDVRSAKTFEDVERIIDLLDAHTQGGLHDILAALDAVKAAVGPSSGAGSAGSASGPGAAAPGGAC